MGEPESVEAGLDLIAEVLSISNVPRFSHPEALVVKLGGKLSSMFHAEFSESELLLLEIMNLIIFFLYFNQSHNFQLQ